MMRSVRCVFVLLTVVVLTFVISGVDAQLLKKIIKSEGGGGSDVVDLISNIPDDAQILLSVNWENLAKTELLEMGKQALGEDFAIIEQMGIDVEKDVKHLIFALTLEEQPDVYGVLAGSFDSKKIIGLIEESGGEVERTRMGPHTVYAIETLYLTFTDTGVLFAASETDGEGAMEKMLRAGRGNLANNEEMVDLVEDVDTSATAWGTVIITDEVREEMAADAGDEVPFDIESLRMANMSLDYGRTVTLEAAVYFSRSSESEKLVQFLKDQISAAMESTDIPAEARSMLDALRLSAKGKVAQGSLSMSSAEFQEAIKQMMSEVGPPEEEWEDEWGEEEDDDDDDDDDDWDDDDDDDWDDDDDDDDDDWD
jgi:hypothetical protein